MKFVLISPRISIQKGDFLGSGVPYWPIEMAILASQLNKDHHEVKVLDLFGLNPFRLEEAKSSSNYLFQGQPLEEALSPQDLDDRPVILLYALSYMSHNDLLGSLRYLRKQSPESVLGVFENSQAVTAYSLSHVKDSLLDAGADFLICGEIFHNLNEIYSYVLQARSGTFDEALAKPQNLIDKNKTSAQRLYKMTPSYETPAWDLFPYQNYWRLPYSHGPKTKTFFPIFTSRGCPYPCDFCVVPTTNERKWRGRPALEVVSEMLHLKKTYGVRDFQIEDLNPTINHKRMNEICDLLIEANEGVRFYIVSGTKAETVPVDSIEKYFKAGLRYLSISPESGSESVMKSIGKPFDYDHGLRLVEKCAQVGVRTQACFVVGHPTETDQDYKKSRDYLVKLMRKGLDEAAFFVVSPFAGSQLFQKEKIQISDEDSLISFSPKGRSDYHLVESRRKSLIRLFFIEKFKQKFKVFGQGLRALWGAPQTKMENLPLRVLFILRLLWIKKISARERKPSV